jgi:hypothetical protein
MTIFENALPEIISVLFCGAVFAAVRYHRVTIELKNELAEQKKITDQMQAEILQFKKEALDSKAEIDRLTAVQLYQEDKGIFNP